MADSEESKGIGLRPRQYGLTEAFREHIGEVIYHTFWHAPLPTLKKAGVVSVKGVVGRRQSTKGGLEYVVSVDFFLAPEKTFEDALRGLPTLEVFQDEYGAKSRLGYLFGCDVDYL